MIVQVDGAEHKSACLLILRMRLPSLMALAGRRRDGENGQVGVGEALLTRPGGQGDNHGAKVAGAGLRDPVNQGILGVQVNLEARQSIAGAIGLAETRASTRQDAEHDDPLCVPGVSALRRLAALPASCSSAGRASLVQAMTASRNLMAPAQAGPPAKTDRARL